MAITQILLTHTTQELPLLFSEAALNRLQQSGEVRLNPLDRHLTGAEMLDLAPKAEAIISEWATGMDAEYLRSATHLKVFVRSGVEILNVDMPCATELGVIIANTPGLYVTTVVELVVGFMINLAHNLVEKHNQLQKGVVTPQTVGFEIAGKTLGIVGFGDIGEHLAVVARALGMTVLTSDPYITSVPDHVTHLPLNELLTRSDFVSLHAKLTSETRGMIGFDQLKLMKPGAFLINTARGPIVDEDAVVEALESGHLGGAAFDVFATEPDYLASPLLNAPRVITTPHNGAFSFETMARQAEAAVRAVEIVLSGDIQNDELSVVNREVLTVAQLRA